MMAQQEESTNGSSTANGVPGPDGAIMSAPSFVRDILGARAGKINSVGRSLLDLRYVTDECWPLIYAARTTNASSR